MGDLDRPARRVLVTGAASGLGLELARLFAECGDQVLSTDTDPIVPGSVSGPYRQLDVRSDEDWAGALDWLGGQWGGLDLLVNNAGLAAGGRIDAIPMTEWERLVQVNLLGVARGCRAVTPLFKRQGSGHIVNVASLAGLVHPPAMSAYSATKAGVVALSESLRHELAPWGIEVSVACPSFFRTNLGRSLSDSDPIMAPVAHRLIDQAPRDARPVAVQVLEGIERGMPVILTDPQGRRAWWTRRWSPRLLQAQLARQARSLYLAEQAGEQPGKPVGEQPGKPAGEQPGEPADPPTATD